MRGEIGLLRRPTSEMGLREKVAALRSRVHAGIRGQADGLRAADGSGIEATLDVFLIGLLFAGHLRGIGLERLAAGVPGFLGLHDDQILTRIGALTEGLERDLRACLPEELSLEELETLSEPFHDEADRKHWGKFYTPRFVVEHILDHTLAPKLEKKGVEGTRLLEPSCGAGDFVLPAYDRFASAYAAAGLERVEAHHTILTRNLFAMDTDPVGVALTRMELALRCEEALRDGELPKLNVHRANALLAGLEPLPPARTDERRGRRNREVAQLPLGLGRALPGAGDGERRSDAVDPSPSPSLESVVAMLLGGFDVVVGNPPFGARIPRAFEAPIRRHYSVVSGKIETAALFLERSLALAHPDGGAAGLIMPHSFSRSGAYKKARELLTDRTRLTTLVDLGSCFPGVSFNTMAFTAVRGGSRGDVSLCRVAAEGTIRRTSKVPHDLFLGRDTLPMHVPAGWLDTLQTIEMRAEPLRSIVKIQRGVNLKGRAAVVTRQSGANRVPVVRGRDIRPYEILAPTRLPSVPRKLAARPASRFPEIVIQNISTEIEATLMPQGMFPLDTVNILWVRNDDVEKEYLVGLLNSRFLAFYFRNLLINRATLTIHLDDPVLGGLPIIVASPSIRRKVVKAVTDLFSAKRQQEGLGGSIEGERERLQARVAKLMRRVDELVDRIYGLTDELARRLDEESEDETVQDEEEE